jgi:hypothetical protein
MVNSAMSQSMKQERLAGLLNTVAKPQPAKAKLDDNAVVRASNLLKLAVARSGVQFKTLSDDRAQTSKKISGTDDHKLWFHEMIAEWPAEVWRELLPLIALEVCPGKFEVERAVTIKEKAS